MQTDFAANDALIVKKWSTQTWKALRNTLFWTANGLISGGLQDSNAAVHYVNDLTVMPGVGTRCVMPLIQELTEDGMVGDFTLDGNEEELITDHQEIRVHQLRHAVKSKGRYSETQTVLRFRTAAREKLSHWGSDRLDELHFLVASGVAFTTRLNGAARPSKSQFPLLNFAADVVVPSTGRQVFAGAATSTATLTAGDKMSWKLLIESKALAVRRRFRPIRRRGINHYMVVMSAEQARDLKIDSDYMTNVGRAGVRGATNPLFSGAFAEIDGLALYEHNRVYNTLGLADGSKWGAGGDMDGAQALLLGAQGIGFARIGNLMWHESDNTDYGNKQGIAFGGMFGLLKPQFNMPDEGNTKQDYGVISVYTAAAPGA